tara:strand:+ start:31935 stop:32240 length:306 start_codon:yes stop_codon:yes gene_type:complete
MLPSNILQEIEDLAAVSGFSLKEIAVYLNLDEKKLYKQYSDRESEVYKAYQRGLLTSKYEVDQALGADAKTGNYTAIQIQMKREYDTKLENVKMNLIQGDL